LARVPEERIQAVQDAVDIVDVISRYVTLKRSGSSLKGLCPFHEEKTPSFSVFPESQRFKCFGCGEGGDVFGFLMRRNNLGFREVLEELAAEAGIELPREEEGPEERAQGQRRQASLEVLRFAAGFYAAVLRRDVGRAALDYLASRGFLDETIAAFGLGFAPDEYDGFWTYARRHGHSVEAMFDAGLVRRNERGEPFDMFRGRVMFPIRDLRGQVIGFGARALGDAQPKYLNSPDGPLFHKGREMYGLHLARPAALRAGRLVLVEGYTDVMHCAQAGLPEAAAALGTALTAENARQLRRFGVPISLLYDGDEAGRRAAERAADVLLAEQVDGSVALLPPGRDPAEVALEDGIDALEDALQRSRDLWSYRMERALERHGSSLEGRDRASRELLESIGRMADPLRRDLAFKLLSEALGVPESTFRDQWRGTGRTGEVRRTGDAPPPAAPEPWVRAERDFVRGAMADPGLWDRVEAVHPPERFRDATLRRVALAIRDLRLEGQWVTREALLGRLADEDAAVRMLLSLEEDRDVLERVQVHLAGIARQDQLRAARASASLEEALRARQGPSSASTSSTENS